MKIADINHNIAPLLITNDKQFTPDVFSHLEKCEKIPIYQLICKNIENSIKIYKQQNSKIKCLNLDELDLISEQLEEFDDKIKIETDKRLTRIPDKSIEITDLTNQACNIELELDHVTEDLEDRKEVFNNYSEKTRESKEKFNNAYEKQQSLKHDIKLEEENIKFIKRKQNTVNSKMNDKRDGPMEIFNKYKNKRDDCYRELKLSIEEGKREREKTLEYITTLNRQSINLQNFNTSFLQNNDVKPENEKRKRNAYFKTKLKKLNELLENNIGDLNEIV